MGSRLRLRGLALAQQQLQTRDLRGLEQLRKDLVRQSKDLKSPVLAQLAKLLDSSGLADDHFVKVRGLIKDLITRLEQDAVDEATAKSNCDTQIKDAVGTRDEKAHEVEGLESGISATSAAISALEEDISSLSQEIADLHKALNELTTLREADKAENNQTSFDAAAGAAAVREAISVLQNFYGTDLLQKKYVPPNADRAGNTFEDVAPETFEGEYTGKTQESKGIFGLLEVIAADFDRTASATEEAEKKAEADFEAQNTLMTGQIDDKGVLKDTKAGEEESKKDELITLKDDLKSAQTLHAEALETLEKLNAACVDTGESWEERTAQREKEIEALKEALSILDSWQA